MCGHDLLVYRISPTVVVVTRYFFRIFPTVVAVTRYFSSHISNCCSGDSLVYRIFPTVVAGKSYCITYSQLLLQWLAVVSHIPNCCSGDQLLYHISLTVVAVTSCCITYPQLLWWWLAIVSHIPNCCSGDQLLYHISPTVVAVTRYFLSHIPNCCSVDSQFYWKVLSFFSTFSDNVRVTCDNLLAWKHVGVRLLRQLSRVPSSAYCIINMNSVYGLVFTRHFNFENNYSLDIKTQFV